MKGYVISWLLVLVAGFELGQGVRVLRNTVDTSIIDPTGGTRLNSVTDAVYVQDVTFCIRFLVKVLGHWERRALLIRIEDWRSDTNDPDFRLLWFDAWYPETFFGFGYPQAHGSYASYLLKDPDLNSYKVWNPNKWSHVCISYQKENSFIRMDGRTMNLNFSDPNLANVAIPPDFLNKTYIGRCATAAKGCSAPSAIFTDFNVWNRALSEQEMQDWTACRRMTEGNIVQWSTSTYDLENMVEEDLPVEPSQLCKPFRMGYVFFPELRNISATLDLCRKLKGVIPVVTSEQIQNDLIKIFRDHFPAQTDPDQLWGGWWDDDENGEFENINTGEVLKPGDFQPWYAGEPNGGEIENCVNIWPPRKAWNDNRCDSKAWTFCEFETPPYLQIRGLCFGSVFDHKYSWTGQLMHGHHSFQGYTDTVLYLDPESSLWRLESYTYPDVYATTDSIEYPFGTQRWIVYNDPCYETNTTEVMLNFNSCTDEEFNCVDGSCIHISARCDGRIDCADKTDEIACEMIEIDQSYIKEIPASPKNRPGQANSSRSSLLDIIIDMEVLSVLEINEVEGVFAVQFKLRLTWLDKRLVLTNLKSVDYLNTLTFHDTEKIWIPQIVFFNTEQKEGSVNDEKAHVTIQRTGRNKLSPPINLENVHVYKGIDNPLTIHRVYSIKFLCEYDMRNYPFDIQSCSIKTVLKGNVGNYARLTLGDLKYLGAIDLTQYYIKEWNMFYSKVTGDQNSVEIKIVLGRRIVNEVLTTYLPTILICIVAFSTNYFKSFFFEAIVTVNLTSLLVLTTLFISVSDSLPKTSYVKMIDIWLIAVLGVPFMEVILHTIVDALRNEGIDKKEIPKVTEVVPLAFVETVEKTGRPKELVARDEKVEVGARRAYYQKMASKVTQDATIMIVCKAILRKGLPSVFILFSIIYFGLGMSYSNK